MLLICFQVSGLALHSVWSDNAQRPDETLGHDASRVSHPKYHINYFQSD